MFYRLHSIAQCGRKSVIQDFDLCKDTALVEVFLILHYLFRIGVIEAFFLLRDDHTYPVFHTLFFFKENSTSTQHILKRTIQLQSSLMSFSRTIPLFSFFLLTHIFLWYTYWAWDCFARHSVITLSFGLEKVCFCVSHEAQIAAYRSQRYLQLHIPLVGPGAPIPVCNAGIECSCSSYTQPLQVNDSSAFSCRRGNDNICSRNTVQWCKGINFY